MRFTEILELFPEGRPRRTGAEDRFWDEIARLGTPLVDSYASDSSLRDVTFLFRAAGPEVRSVRLVANRVTDKHRQAAGIMRQVPDTGIWGVTLTLPADLRVSYGFSPSSSTVPKPMRTGRSLGPPVLVDPCNVDPPLRRPDAPVTGSVPGEQGMSVFSGPSAPDHGPWLSEFPLRGSVTVSTRTIAGFDCPVHVYSPRTGRPRALLVLFDGDEWFHSLGVAQACEAAGLAPLVIVGIGAADREQRIETLGGHQDFLKDICVTLLPQIERELSQRGCSLPERSGRIVSGQSLGGLSSLLMALVAPEAFGTVLAQSASLWWRPGSEASPAGLSRADPGRGAHDDWLTGRFLDSGDLDVALHLTVGSREELMVGQHRRLHEVLLDRARASTLSVYRGGHDYACWRGALIDGLQTLLVTDAESPAGARNAPDSANSPQG